MVRDWRDGLQRSRDRKYHCMPKQGMLHFPMYNPSINSRGGCKNAWTYFNAQSGGTTENKYKCVWCNKGRANRDDLCPSVYNPLNGNTIMLGGCGGCTNAGYWSQSQNFDGRTPTCGTADCELKSDLSVPVSVLAVEEEDCASKTVVVMERDACVLSLTHTAGWETWITLSSLITIKKKKLKN